MGVTESHREPERDREGASKRQLEPEGARVGITESHREQERDKERAIVYLNIVLLQNN